MPVRKGKDDRYVYENPKDLNGKEYWVSTVEKNKDRLVGYIEGLYTGFNILEEDMYYKPSLGLSSERFTDLLPDGSRLSSLTEKELIKYISDLLKEGVNRNKKQHPDDTVDMSSYFYYADCFCGMFYTWAESADIPDEDFNCPHCGRKVIEYINVEDNEVDYIGIDRDFYSNTISKIRDEMGL